MSIGDGPDIEQFNRAEEKLVKLGDEVQAWWDSMDDKYKYEIMEGYYPDHSHLLDLTEMWEGISWENQLDVYGSSEGAIEL